MSQKVVVTGFGIISALGTNVDENFNSLKAGDSGVKKSKYLKSEYSNTKVCGEVNLSNEQLRKEIGYTANDINCRTTLLGLHAVSEAVNSSNLENSHLKGAMFMNGTSVGGMVLTEQYFKEYKEGKPGDYKDIFKSHDCGYSTEIIANKFNICGGTVTISTACSSSANTIMQGARYINAGRTDVVIAGGTDALSKFTINGFNSLKILDDNPCKPFDINRKGLNLGEAAAYLVLESEDHARSRGANIIGEVIGYGNANDAHHQTASSPEGNGAKLAMSKALKMAENIDIDYINAHGTGTENNDSSESAAIEGIFGENVPNFSTTKAYTGHTLGAAGAVEAVISLLSIKNDLIFPCLRIEEPLLIGSSKPIVELTSHVVNTVLSNSLGFGGNCTTLIFNKLR
ncbi:beta-ketoacyl-[acyl-carrier-protein] synthase family protein [Marinigracilibium pacificum]|uniref:Beta-ketoacyl-[acyl-carrier-protein] synthase family protein n=1 Tax=Marinigracilibium pacificum TaxID=2729599 RepID=A0A848IU72_9BACT|nr:beta-ketoacyl-[acyl-carrier-protein] synthase family protein [Marinigracilibium pacificum]NMM47887.1 beta-ketoacyl-[acyl-carrier-protein] synthase family protein [Marinigracilibium pacificum]